MQVVCKERGLGIGMLGYRTQVDDSPYAAMLPEIEHYPLEQDGYQVLIIEYLFFQLSCWMPIFLENLNN